MSDIPMSFSEAALEASKTAYASDLKLHERNRLTLPPAATEAVRSNVEIHPVIELPYYDWTTETGGPETNKLDPDGYNAAKKTLS